MIHRGIRKRLDMSRMTSSIASVAVWKGKVYVVSPDCRLIALDAGSVEQAMGGGHSRRSHTGLCLQRRAPTLAGDVILVGNAGADTSPGGMRGYVTAFDLTSGAYRWRFFTVPSRLDGTSSPELQAAAKTWDSTRDPAYGGGGNVWNAMAYDPKRRTVYLGTGNAAPYGANRDDQGRTTDSLYTASIVALNADSGKLVWYYQTTPGDRWDFDATATMVLADLDIDGHRRATLLQANKNGYFYVIDRETGVPISVRPFAYVNWSSGIDRDFRPIVTGASRYHSAPQLIYPSVQGAHSWTPMAFSPKTGLAYVPAIDAPSFLVDLKRNPGAQMKFVDGATDGVAYIVPDRDYDPAAWTALVGALPRVPALNPKTGKARVRSSLIAWDPVRQKVVWEQQTSDGYLVVDGGSLATGGDVVFAGREDGSFVAYDAKSGTVLTALSTGTPIMAAPMSYEVNGTQYVAVMGAHGGGYLGSFVGTAAMKYINDGRIMVFKLGGKTDVPKPAAREMKPYTQPPRSTATPQQVKAGMELFNTWCARCHSLGLPGATPDLSRLQDGIDNIEVFNAIVLKGAFLSRGMARFDDALSPSDTDSLHAYLIDEATRNFKSAAPEGSGRQ